MAKAQRPTVKKEKRGTVARELEVLYFWRKNGDLVRGKKMKIGFHIKKTIKIKAEERRDEVKDLTISFCIGRRVRVLGFGSH